MSALLALLIFSQSHAFTRLQFVFDRQALVIVTNHSPEGQLDPDSAHLFELMNVPAQDSFLGPGKAIVSENKDLSFVCGTEPGHGPMCTIVFNPSSRVHWDASRQTIHYQMSGEEAKDVSTKWKTKNGSLEFISSDRKIRMNVLDDEFRLEVNGNGL